MPNGKDASVPQRLISLSCVLSERHPFNVTSTNVNVLPRVLLAHPGTQYSHHLAAELYRRDYLGRFYTCFSFSDELSLVKMTRHFAKFLKVERQWQNRIVEGVPAEKLRCFPLLEIEAWYHSRSHISAA